MIDFTDSDPGPGIREFIEKENIVSLDFKFCDLTGAWRHMTVPVSGLQDDLFKKGIGVDGSSVPEYADVNRGDMVIVPDLSKGYIDDAYDMPCLSFICDVFRADDMTPHYADPRGVALRASEFLASRPGLNDIAFLPELEFYIFDQVEYNSGSEEAYWRISSAEGSSDPPAADGGCGHSAAPNRWKLRDGEGYVAVPPMDSFINVRDIMVSRLNEAGVDIKYHHHEVGSFGQQELELQLNGLLDTADNILLGKYIARITAAELGLVTTFMPKPFPDKAGTGLHYHMQLRKDGIPASHDPDGYAGLSKEALSFIAGVLHHGRAVMAFTSGSTNSYRRLKPGFETPTSFFFSVANREAAIRIPLYAKEPAEKRWEFRPSDATGNPYLAMPAILMAGLDGIDKGMDPGKEGFGPFDGPGPQLTRTAENLSKLLPTSLSEALTALNDDMDFLLKGGVFTSELVKTYINYKFVREISALQGHPHPFEFELYFNL